MGLKNKAMAKTNHKNTKEKPDLIKWLKILWGVFLGGILFLVLLFVFISQGFLGTMPSFEELENPQSSQASLLFADDGRLLGSYYIENRSDVDFRNLSPNLVNALIATEDIRYYKHSGIDFKALVRVLVGVVTGDNRGGGSTITQQLAKQLFTESSGSKLARVKQKLNEWVIAVKLERSYSKEEIIAMYFNKYDFINNADGIQTAARVYFGTTPDSLELTEAATLVGMLKNSALYNPFRRPGMVIERRNVVLDQMYHYDYIDQLTHDSAVVQPLGLNVNRQSHTDGMANYLREYLRGYLKEWTAANLKPDGTSYDLYRDGLRIYTSINYDMQFYAEKAVKEHLGKDLQPAFDKHWKGYTNGPFNFDNNLKEEVEKILKATKLRSERYRLMKKANIPNDSIDIAFETPTEMTVFSWKGDIDTIMTPMDSIRYYKKFLQTGVMSVQPQTGQVKAYVGGIDFRYFKYDHVTQAKRQVGSTFKPFVYTLAMQEGNMSPCSKIANVQPIIKLADGTYWKPRNSNDEREGQEVTLKWALANSINWISAHLIDKYNPAAVVKMAHNMGITSYIPPVHAIALGTPDISLYEMVGAMATFANKGVHLKPIFITRIEDKTGNVLERFTPESNEAMSEETAYLMLSLMKGVVESGTGVRLRYKYGFSNPIAGKTGTTQNQSDGWFMGITPKLVTGVWVGAEDRSVHFRSISLGQGANMALPVWALYMKDVYADEDIGLDMGDFEMPAKPLSVEINCDQVETLKRKKLYEDENDF